MNAHRGSRWYHPTTLYTGYAAVQRVFRLQRDVSKPASPDRRDDRSLLAGTRTSPMIISTAIRPSRTLLTSGDVKSQNLDEDLRRPSQRLSCLSSAWLGVQPMDSGKARA